MSTTLASAQDSPLGIAVDSASVYWTDCRHWSQVMRAGLDGGIPVTLATQQDEPWGIAVDAHRVHRTTISGGVVVKAPLEGGTPITLASDRANPMSLAAGGASVYASWGSCGACHPLMARNDGGSRALPDRLLGGLGRTQLREVRARPGLPGRKR